MARARARVPYNLFVLPLPVRGWRRKTAGGVRLTVLSSRYTLCCRRGGKKIGALFFCRCNLKLIKTIEAFSRGSSVFFVRTLSASVCLSLYLSLSLSRCLLSLSTLSRSFESSISLRMKRTERMYVRQLVDYAADVVEHRMSRVFSPASFVWRVFVFLSRASAILKYYITYLFGLFFLNRALVEEKVSSASGVFTFFSLRRKCLGAWASANESISKLHFITSNVRNVRVFWTSIENRRSQYLGLL